MNKLLSVLCALSNDLHLHREGQNIFSVKWQKTTDPHKESRAKKEEKGKDNENL